MAGLEYGITIMATASEHGKKVRFLPMLSVNALTSLI